MSLYTERHGMRNPIKKTASISIKVYALLYDCCERYFENLAWKYPEECPDGYGCCGLSLEKFNTAMEFEIPTLFRRNGFIDKPQSAKKIYSGEIANDSFDQYALLDLIEFVAQNIRDIKSRNYHSFYRHNDLSFRTTNAIAHTFLNEINDIFQKTGLLYHLTPQLNVERIEDTPILSGKIEQDISSIKEPGIRELLVVAIQKHKSPYPDDQKDAVEKIWDALERLKTYYVNKDKKASVTQIIGDMAGGNENYISLFNAEFKALTDIGNHYRIRHHETDKIDITDIRYYDYFFNRCLSLVAIAIQYLQ